MNESFAKGNRATDRDLVLKPGDFFITEENGDGLRRVHLWLPGFDSKVILPIIAGPTREGPIWGWNVDEDKPTLMPSIRSSQGEGRAGWHGHLAHGDLIPC